MSSIQSLHGEYIVPSSSVPPGLKHAMGLDDTSTNSADEEM